MNVFCRLHYYCCNNTLSMYCFVSNNGLDVVSRRAAQQFLGSANRNPTSFSIAVFTACYWLPYTFL